MDDLRNIVGHRDSRRDFIKKGAVAGGLVWAAPAVLAINKAAAQVGGSPAPCTCTASAFGLQVIIPSLSIDQTVPCATGLVTIGQPGLRVFATVACGTANGCSADASLANLKIDYPDANGNTV